MSGTYQNSGDYQQTVSEDKYFGVVDYKAIDFSRINPYEFVREADNGSGRIVKGDYLIPHTRERRFAERKNFTYYLPHFKRVIQALVSPIFSERPKRNWNKDDELLNHFFQNCDRRGTPFSLFIQDAAERACRYGCMFYVVDNVRNPSPTLAEAVRNIEHPTIYTVSPELVRRIDLDEDGVITRFQYFDRAATANGSKKEDYVYREITATGWRTFNVDEKGAETLLDYGEYTIGRIPVIAYYDKQPEDEEDLALPMPPMYHIAKLCVAGIYNLGSEIREADRGQAFSILAMPEADGVTVGTGIVIGTGNGIKYNPKDGGRPLYLSPDPEVLRVLLEQKKFMIEQLFEAVSVVGVQAMQKKESGEQVRLTFRATSHALLTRTEKQQSLEYRIMEIHDLFANRESGFSVEYSTNFGMLETSDLIQQTTDAVNIPGLGIKSRQQLLVSFVKERFRDLPPEKVSELIVEAEQATFDAAYLEPGKQAI